jgi:hypothetical protein
MGDSANVRDNGCSLYAYHFSILGSQLIFDTHELVLHPYSSDWLLLIHP